MGTQRTFEFYFFKEKTFPSSVAETQMSNDKGIGYISMKKIGGEKHKMQ